MSNLLKSKFLLGVVLVAVLVVGGFSVASEASAQQAVVSASDIQYAATVKLGSSGQASLIWQKFFNHYSTANLVADGAFGPLTNAAAKTWQASRGLAADGVLGPMSRASAIAQIGGGGPVASGCMPGQAFNPLTGAPCTTTGPSTVPGCMAGYMFSPTTGQACSGGSTPSTPGTLQGGAGDLESADFLSSLNNEEVGEDREDVEVAGLELEADDGSDLELRSVQLVFTGGADAALEDGSDNDHEDFEDYATEVSLWLDGEEIARVDADEFDDDNDYTKSVTVDSGAVIEAGETGDLVVAISAVGNLDSASVTDEWTVSFGSVRYMDAQGAILTESALNDIGAEERTFSFESFATSADSEMKISLGDDAINSGHVISLDGDEETEADILAFNVEVEGDSDLEVDDIVVEFVTTSAANIDEMVSTIYLYMDGEEIASENVATNEDTVTFDDLDLTLRSGDEYEFVVSVDLLDADGILIDAGDTILAKVTQTERELWDVDDENGDRLANANRTGTAIGEAHTVYENAVNVEMGTVTYTTVTDGANTEQVTYNIPLEVTAFGDTRYVGLSAQYEATHTDITDDLALTFALQDSTAPSTDLENGTVSSTLTCDATIEGGTAYRLDEDSTVDCDLQVIHTAPGTASRSYRVHVEGFQTYSDAALSADELIQLLAPTADFQTAYKFITS